jgi:hypothetical protein
MRNHMATVWRKASYSDGHGACVEVAVLPDGTIGVRDSKNPDRRLPLSTRAWTTFLIRAKGGHFDL